MANRKRQSYGRDVMDWERAFDDRFLPADMAKMIGWRGLSYRVNFHEVKNFIRDLLKEKGGIDDAA